MSRVDLKVTSKKSIYEVTFKRPVLVIYYLAIVITCLQVSGDSKKNWGDLHCTSKRTLKESLNVFHILDALNYKRIE